MGFSSDDVGWSILVQFLNISWVIGWMWGMYNYGFTHLIVIVLSLSTFAVVPPVLFWYTDQSIGVILPYAMALVCLMVVEMSRCSCSRGGIMRMVIGGIIKTWLLFHAFFVAILEIDKIYTIPNSVASILLGLVILFPRHRPDNEVNLNRFDENIAVLFPEEYNMHHKEEEKEDFELEDPDRDFINSHVMSEEQTHETQQPNRRPRPVYVIIPYDWLFLHASVMLCLFATFEHGQYFVMMVLGLLLPLLMSSPVTQRHKWLHYQLVSIIAVIAGIVILDSTGLLDRSSWDSELAEEVIGSWGILNAWISLLLFVMRLKQMCVQYMNEHSSDGYAKKDNNNRGETQHPSKTTRRNNDRNIIKLKLTNGHPVTRLNTNPSLPSSSSSTLGHSFGGGTFHMNL